MLVFSFCLVYVLFSFSYASTLGALFKPESDSLHVHAHLPNKADADSENYTRGKF